MTNYRRLISYIYAYEGETKGKNIGFAKLESRNGQCKLSVNVKKVYVGSSDLGVYLLAPGKEIPLGNIFIRGGSGEFRAAVSVENAADSGCSLDRCYGLTIHEPDDAWRAYTTIWEDAVAHAAEIELADVTSGKVGDADEQINKKVEELAREIGEADNDSGKMSGTAETDAENASDVEALLFSASAPLAQANLAEAKIDAAQITAAEAPPEREQSPDMKEQSAEDSQLEEEQIVSEEQLMPEDEIPVWGEAPESREQTADANVYPEAESVTDMQMQPPASVQYDMGTPQYLESQPDMENQPVEEQRSANPCHPQRDTTYSSVQPAMEMPFHMNRHPKSDMTMRGNVKPPAGNPVRGNMQAPAGMPVRGNIQTPAGMPVREDIQTPAGVPVRGDMQPSVGVLMRGNMQPSAGMPMRRNIQPSAGTPVRGNMQPSTGMLSRGNMQVPAGMSTRDKVQPPAGVPSQDNTQFPENIPVENIQPPTEMPSKDNTQLMENMPADDMQPLATVPEASNAQPSPNDLDNTAMQRPNNAPYPINRQNRRAIQPRPGARFQRGMVPQPAIRQEAELPVRPQIQPGDLTLDENGAQSKTPVIDSGSEEIALGNPQELERLEQEEQENSGPLKLWEGFRKQYPKIKAFDSVNGCEILTIKPQDIGLLPRENWNYGNNSFLLHGYYNYRYLILARIGDESQGRTRYILGVPGHYYSNEKYMASMFGFPHFVLSKKQPSQDGRFGYWYTDVRMENQD